MKAFMSLLAVLVVAVAVVAVVYMVMNDGNTTRLTETHLPAVEAPEVEIDVPAAAR